MEMEYLILGYVAFLLFVVYDINSIIMKIKLLYCCFLLGVILITVSTIGIVITNWNITRLEVITAGIFGVLSVLFLTLLIYTLFFALPFKDTYIEVEDSRKVCQSGVYALCRHPGVLWFIGFYFSLGLALKIPLLMIAAAIFSVSNILYVLFQDRWTFTKMFDNYNEYKMETPFLIPKMKSIKRCISHFRRKVQCHEI